MVDTRYAADIVQVRRELDAAIEERDRANVKIISLQAKLRALYALSDQDSLTPDDDEVVGLTEAVRSILRLAGRPMQANEVKTNLDVMGFNFRGVSNASAAVHNTLKRMRGTGELTYTEGKGYMQHPLDAARERFTEALNKMKGKTAPASSLPTVGQKVFRGMQAAKERAAKEKK
jgi:hypothetical protein